MNSGKDYVGFSSSPTTRRRESKSYGKKKGQIASRHEVGTSDWTHGVTEHMLQMGSRGQACRNTLAKGRRAGKSTCKWRALYTLWRGRAHGGP